MNFNVANLMYRPTFVPPKPNAKGKGNLYYFFVVKMPFAERAAELNVCTAPVTDFLSQCQTGSSVTDFLLGGESCVRCVDEPHYFTLSIQKKKKSGPVRMSIVILETDTSCRI